MTDTKTVERLLSEMRTFAVIFMPFIWVKPRIDSAVLDTVVYFGPLRIRWKNK